ncbi:unnamed protein product, partial [Trichogramma brassicae]
MRSNHHGLAESLYRKNIIADKTCKCGHFEEELNHVLWSCELYQTQRRKLLDKLRLLGHPPPLNVESLIARPNIEACWVYVNTVIRSRARAREKEISASSPRAAGSSRKQSYVLARQSQSQRAARKPTLY